MRDRHSQPQQVRRRESKHGLSLTDRKKTAGRAQCGCLRNGERFPSPAFLGRGVLGLTTTPHGDGPHLPPQRSSMRPVKGFTCPPV